MYIAPQALYCTICNSN